MFEDIMPIAGIFPGASGTPPPTILTNIPVFYAGRATRPLQTANRRTIENKSNQIGEFIEPSSG